MGSRIVTRVLFWVLAFSAMLSPLSITWRVRLINLKIEEAQAETAFGAEQSLSGDTKEITGQDINLPKIRVFKKQQDMVAPVTDPKKMVTDLVLLKELSRQGIDKDYVELFGDYAPRSPGKESSPYAQFYRDRKSGKRFMITQGLPMVTADGARIEPGWNKLSATEFRSKVNLFLAEVEGNQVALTVLNDQPDGRKKNDQLTFRAQLFLNGVEQMPAGPVLLAVDPVNPNYQNNVLEWDYGIAKRRLRIIEGRFLGNWIFNANPGGDVRITYNQTGDYRLKLGQCKVNDDEEFIPASVFASATYPFEVSDSATYYPDDTYTKLLLHADGSGASFVDSSSAPHTITAYGNTTQSTTQSKFGGKSGYFDGDGDYLETPDSADWTFGSGNFTIDFWVRFDSLTGPAGNMLIMEHLTDTSNLWRFYWDTTAAMIFTVVSGGTYIVDTRQGNLTGWSANTWYHVALVRNGNVWTIYRDGVAMSTTTDSDAVPDFTGAVDIGRIRYSDGDYFKGYLDEVRISKGIARWTSNFTPPTAAYSIMSVDGAILRDNTDETWASIRAGTDGGIYAGIYESDAAGTFYGFRSGSAVNTWTRLYRSWFLFDTSSLPDNAVITSATFSLYITGKQAVSGSNPNFNLFSSSPASNTTLVTGDFDQVGSTALATAIAYADIVTGQYNDLTLNTTGLANITKTGISKFSVRSDYHDAQGNTPTYSQLNYDTVGGYFSEQGAGYQPKLVVTYTVTETIINNATINNMRIGYWGLGSSQNPGSSCNQIKVAETASGDGAYWIDPDGAGGSAAFQAYCDMTTDGGGWTLVAAAIGGDSPGSTWGGTGGIDVSDATYGNRTFRFSDATITNIKSVSTLMRATKSHGITAFATPPATFDSTASNHGDPICDNIALTLNCVAGYSDVNTGPWGLYHGWPGNKTAVISGRNVCANKFGVTDYLCDSDHWGNSAVWLKLWLR